MDDLRDMLSAAEFGLWNKYLYPIVPGHGLIIR